MSIIGSLIGGGISSIISAGNEVVKTWRGDKAAMEAAVHQEIMGVQAAYIAETSKPNTNWFDSFADGMNRLVRPFCTYGVIALFWWAAADPASFNGTMDALTAVPEWLQVLAASIIGFWFVVRGTTDVMQSRAAPMVQRAVADTAKTVTTKIAGEIAKADTTSDVNNPTMAAFKAKKAARKEPIWDAQNRKWIKE